MPSIVFVLKELFDATAFRPMSDLRFQPKLSDMGDGTLSARSPDPPKEDSWVKIILGGVPAA